MNIRIKKMHPDGKTPVYVQPGDVAMDLFSRETKTLQPGERALFFIGYAFEIPSGHAGLIWDRSGLSNKQGLKLLGGVIDSNYRGEIAVGLVNLSQAAYTITAGDRVAQMLIQPVENPTLEEVAELSETVRGVGGFGSTGK